jgi:hypothetical protein
MNAALTRLTKLPPIVGLAKSVKSTLWNPAELGGSAKDGAAAALPGLEPQPFPAGPAGGTLRRLDAWLGVSQTAGRQWRERLPAVAAASLVLTGYAWSAGLKPVDLRLALVLGLSAAVLGRFTDSE